MASGTAPPYMPEWTAWSRVRTVTTPSTRPRRLVVSAGCPTRQLPESATHDDVRGEPLAVLARKRSNEGEPISSSPSTNTVTPTPGAAPSARARSAATCTATPALSSAAPRP